MIIYLSYSIYLNNGFFNNVEKTLQKEGHSVLYEKDYKKSNYDNMKKADLVIFIPKDNAFICLLDKIEDRCKDELEKARELQIPIKLAYVSSQYRIQFYKTDITCDKLSGIPKTSDNGSFVGFKRINENTEKLSPAFKELKNTIDDDFDSLQNSVYDWIQGFQEISLKQEPGKRVYLLL